MKILDCFSVTTEGPSPIISLCMKIKNGSDLENVSIFHSEFALNAKRMDLVVKRSANDMWWKESVESVFWAVLQKSMEYGVKIELLTRIMGNEWDVVLFDMNQRGVDGENGTFCGRNVTIITG